MLRIIGAHGKLVHDGIYIGPQLNDFLNHIFWCIIVLKSVHLNSKVTPWIDCKHDKGVPANLNTNPYNNKQTHLGWVIETPYVLIGNLHAHP